MKTSEDDGAADDSEVEDNPVEVCDADLFKNHLEAEVAIQKLIDSVAKLGVDPKEVGHLERFQRALLRAKLAKPKKATTMHDFLKKK